MSKKKLKKTEACNCQSCRRKRFAKRKGSLFLRVLFLHFILLLGLISSVSAYGIYLLQKNEETIPDIENYIQPIPLATEIYDRNGTLLYRMHNDYSNSDKVQINFVSNKIRAAFMAAEDANFYNHIGIDPEAILRCALKAASKEDVCGGSTITQQLVKILTKRSDQTLDRKIDEAFLATKLEEKYTKDQILEMYLNLTPYGSNIVGIRTAALYYFGKDNLLDLSLTEAVTLASIVNDPTDLAPINAADKEAVLTKLNERKAHIFAQLEEKREKINAQLIENAKRNNIDFVPYTADFIKEKENEPIAFVESDRGEMKAGHFVNYTIDELQKRIYQDTGEVFSLLDLQTGGYKIYTSLDYGLQQVAERYVMTAGNDYTAYNVHNAAIMTTIPSTGEIITMAGSKSFEGTDEYCDGNGENCMYNPKVNVLTTLQSPGSTAKPLGYLIAFDEGKLFPGSFLPDIPIRFGEYIPKNWDGRYLGISNTTAKEMLRQSRNIPALEVISMIGYQKYIETAQKFGYTSYGDINNYGPSVILGGADVYPLEHVQAYGVYANGGDLVKLNPIKKIIDRDGKVIYEAKPSKERVIDPAAAYQLNQTLRDLPTGTGDVISWGDGRDVAGKTGTTENNIEALLMMYSPDFVTLGWAGNNNNDPLNQLYGWPGYVVAPWLKGYMSEIGGHPLFANKTPFPKPDNSYWGGGDCDAFGLCRGLRADWLISGKEPARGDIRFTKSSPDNNGSSTFGYQMSTPELQGFLNAYLSGRKL